MLASFNCEMYICSYKLRLLCDGYNVKDDIKIF